MVFLWDVSTSRHSIHEDSVQLEVESLSWINWSPSLKCNLKSFTFFYLWTLYDTFLTDFLQLNNSQFERFREPPEIHRLWTWLDSLSSIDIGCSFQAIIPPHTLVEMVISLVNKLPGSADTMSAILFILSDIIFVKLIWALIVAVGFCQKHLYGSLQHFCL